MSKLNSPIPLSLTKVSAIVKAFFNKRVFQDKFNMVTESTYEG